jgi:hypothetical protein
LYILFDGYIRSNILSTRPLSGHEGRKSFLWWMCPLLSIHIRIRFCFIFRIFVSPFSSLNNLFVKTSFQMIYSPQIFITALVFFTIFPNFDFLFISATGFAGS